MDVNRREKIRMLIRFLEPIEEEVRRVLSDEEDNFANRSETSKETWAGQISKEAQHNLDRARSAIDNALDLLRLVVGDDGDGSEQSTEAPWPLVNSSSSRR
jgi:hypothetical protein